LEHEDDEESDPEDSCKPPPSQHKRFGPDNGPWIGIRNQREPDPDWKFLRCLEILQQEESKTFEGFNVFRPGPYIYKTLLEISTHLLHHCLHHHFYDITAYIIISMTSLLTSSVMS